eukprot:SAG11_NODE_1506_length_4781_cov_2.355831_7_plen_120_part_00
MVLSDQLSERAYFVQTLFKGSNVTATFSDFVCGGADCGKADFYLVRGERDLSTWRKADSAGIQYFWSLDIRPPPWSATVLSSEFGAPLSAQCDRNQILILCRFLSTFDGVNSFTMIPSP